MSPNMIEEELETLNAIVSALVWSGLHATRATANNAPTRDFDVDGKGFMPG